MGSTPEDAADVARDIHHLVARISARQAVPQAADTSPKLDAPIRTTDEANATWERRRNLYTEKSVVKQRTPWNTQRLERIQADIQAANARLGDWRKLHPEWRSGG
jgi:multidrug resistance efflux pump